MSQITKGSMVLALAAVLCAPAAHAQDKIGYVNVMAVLEGTIEGKATVSKLKAEGAAKEAEFKKRMQTLGEKYKQFQSRAKMMKEDKAAEQAQALQQEEQELKMLAMQYQTEFQRKQAAALSEFQQKVGGVIETVAKREGIQWVIQQQVLLYGPPKMDLTAQVIREYDKRFKGKTKGKK